MSGGGGGIIIIQQIRETCDMNAVKDEISGWRRTRFDSIMQTPDSQWTHEDVHFMLRCIGYAYDSHC